MGNNNTEPAMRRNTNHLSASVDNERVNNHLEASVSGGTLIHNPTIN